MNQIEELEEDSVLDTDKKRLNSAIAYCCRLLGVREYSSKMIIQRLNQKGYSQEESRQIVEYLKSNNWLSDKRYCESFIRSKISRGQGFTRIAYELKQNGVDNNISEPLFEIMEICWQTLCDDTAQRKMQRIKIKNELDGRQKLERFLRYRGFSGTEIRHSIDKCISQSGVTKGEYDE